MRDSMVTLRAVEALRALNWQAQRPLLEKALISLHDPMTGAGWLDIPEEPDWLSPLRQYAAQIREQADVLVVLGVGGAVNLLRAALDWLGPPVNGLEVQVWGAWGGREAFTARCQALGERRVACCILSKSGQTAETQLLANWCWQWLRERQPENCFQYLYLIAEQGENPLWRQAAGQGWQKLVWPLEIGGRYALVSPAVLLPLAAAGFDVAQILAGARQAVRDSAQMPVTERSAATYGFCRYALQEQGRQQEVWLLPEPRLAGLGQWLCQLFAESEGRQGRGAFPLLLRPPDDLHVYGQLLEDGPSDFWGNALLSAGAADGPFQRLSHIQRQVFCQSQQERGLPWLELKLPCFDEQGLGATVYFFLIACAVSCGLAGLRPWEQPALDRYKQKVEKALREQPSPFGTAGLRGVYGEDFTEELLARAVAAFGQTLSGGIVVIGYDTRRHSCQLAELAASVLRAQGFLPFLFLLPVPAAMISFMTRQMNAAGALNLTASHNPPQYQGCKFYDARGRQLLPAQTADLARRMALLDQVPRATGRVWEDILPYLVEEYLRALRKAALPRQRERAGELKLVYSPLFGSGMDYLPLTLDWAGFQPQLVKEQTEPDGDFPGLSAPNPELPEVYTAAIAKAREVEADLVLVTDADADRLGVAVRQDGDYRQLNSHQVGALLLDWLLRRQPPTPEQPGVLVKSLLVSPLLTEIGRRSGLEVVETLTGFKYQSAILDQLQQEGKQLVLACDETCGYLRGDYTRDKDAILAGLLVAQMAADYRAEGQTLADGLARLQDTYGYFADLAWSLPLPGLELDAWLDKLLDQPPQWRKQQPYRVFDYRRGLGDLPATPMLRLDYRSGLRLLLRPSGTEPQLKCYAQIRAKREDQLQERQRQTELLVKALPLD